MAKAGSITVEVKTKLTISDDTAQTLLGLLEMYCQEKGYVITTEMRINEEGEKEPILNFDRVMEENTEWSREEENESEEE